MQGNTGFVGEAARRPTLATGKFAADPLKYVGAGSQCHGWHAGVSGEAAHSVTAGKYALGGTSQQTHPTGSSNDSDKCDSIQRF